MLEQPLTKSTAACLPKPSRGETGSIALAPAGNDIAGILRRMQQMPAVAWRPTVAAFAAEVGWLLPHAAVVRHNVFDVGPNKRELLDARLQRPAHRNASA